MDSGVAVCLSGPESIEDHSKPSKSGRRRPSLGETYEPIWKIREREGHALKITGGGTQRQR